MAITVLLIDDHAIVRDGLSSLLGREPDIEVVGEASNGADGIELAESVRPEIAIVDIGLRDMNGIEATRAIQKRAPDTRVIALSMLSDTSSVTGMLAAGARGYLVKSGAFEELSLAIRTVSAGGVYLSPSVAGLVVDSLVNRLDASAVSDNPVADLTPRQVEILRLIAEGQTTKQVAARLELGVKTVEAERRRIMDRLGAENSAQLVRIALRAGVVRLDD